MIATIATTTTTTPFAMRSHRQAGYIKGFYWNERLCACTRVLHALDHGAEHAQSLRRCCRRRQRADARRRLSSFGGLRTPRVKRGERVDRGADARNRLGGEEACAWGATGNGRLRACVEGGNARESACVGQVDKTGEVMSVGVRKTNDTDSRAR
eukprot:3582748-Pleurochrysis_carterae.AAC.1